MRRGERGREGGREAERKRERERVKEGMNMNNKAEMRAILPVLRYGERIAGFQFLAQGITLWNSLVTSPFACTGLSGFQFTASERALIC